TLVSSVTAATASAATAAATAERAGLPGGADHRERRKLPGDVRRAALRARNLLIPPDELLKVLLVHRHRQGSLGARPDGSQIAWRADAKFGRRRGRSRPSRAVRSFAVRSGAT